MLKPSLAHSSHRPSQSFQSQVELVNIITFRTTPFRIPFPLNSQIHQLTRVWIQTRFPQPGALFQSFHCLSIVFHQVCNLPLETSQRHTTLYHFTTLNGPSQSFTLIMIHLPLILPYVLGQVHLLECMVQFRMQPQISYASRALDQYLAGWMITCSSTYGPIVSQSITRGIEHGIGTLC